MNDYILYRPTANQELLLKAALLRGRPAFDAWQHWKSGRLDIDLMEAGSKRLLPLLYQNLSSQGINDPVLGRFKEFYREAFIENQMLFKTMAALIHVLQQSGIKTIVLKGAALVLVHYGKYGLRPMSDFDILVPTKHALEAIRILKEQGWIPAQTPRAILNKDYFSVRNGHEFKESSGKSLDLHWYTLADCCYPGADSKFWASATPLDVHGVLTKSLCPTDQLLHVCLHGAKWNTVPSIRWVADAMVVLNTASSQIDWERLTGMAEEFSLSLPLKDTLCYLRGVFDASIPSEVIDELKGIPVSPLVKMAYRAANTPSGLGVRAFFLRFWRYKRHMRRTGFSHEQIGLLRFIQLFFGSDRFIDMPGFVVSRVFLRIRQLSVQ